MSSSENFITDTTFLMSPYDTLDSLMKYYNNTGLKYLSDGNYELAEESF